jgi:5'-3' exonuclease
MGAARHYKGFWTDFIRNTPRSTCSGTLLGRAGLLLEKDEFFAHYTKHRQAEKLLSTYLSKMENPRLHPNFGYLLTTGRTYCEGFTLQNLPREQEVLDADPDAMTIRGSCVPGEGCVFLDSDLSQIELVLLAYVWDKQFGRKSNSLARLINGDRDVHRLIAAGVLNKRPENITKEERNSAKPVSFGRPGGMGAKTLQSIAKANYGIDLTLEQVQQRIEAYHRLCPELTEHLRDELNQGLVIAESLHLTPADFYRATRPYYEPSDPSDDLPAAWLGGMLLRVLCDPVPVTQQGLGRPYTPAEINYLWDKAQHLPLRLKPNLAAKLEQRQADNQLWDTVRNWAGRRSVFTVTGRLRANATFCSSRNCIFQGPAADGAILGLWFIWRAGYKIVNFVHDQVVVESLADDKVRDRVAHVEQLMKAGILAVAPGMLVKVETVITRSLNKKDLDPRYSSQPITMEVKPMDTIVRFPPKILAQQESHSVNDYTHVIVDVLNLAYRYWWTVRDSRTSKGQDNSLESGLCQALARLRARYAGSQLVLAWDGKPQHQREENPAYKAQRRGEHRERPADWQERCQRLCHALSGFFLTLYDPLNEADVEIASYVRHTKADRSLLVSTDRDLFMLLAEHVDILRPGQKPELYRLADFKRDYPFEPCRYALYKALVGDASDNLRGVGYFPTKVATQLATSFLGVDDLFKAVQRGRYHPILATLTEKQRSKLAMAENRIRSNHRLIDLLAYEEHPHFQSPENLDLFDELCLELELKNFWDLLPPTPKQDGTRRTFATLAGP